MTCIALGIGDGNGYPKGIVGKEIPLWGRIVSIADVFDALTTIRPYKKPFSNEISFNMIEEKKGIQFDAELVDVFFERSEDIIKIQETFKDENQIDFQSAR